ncbi:MAG TPA: Ig-like domain-containing protein [Gemmatimonadaceae bacterium]|nr:Ig-like domain-containing protein [Gemmatimonadaceae bacterium]
MERPIRALAVVAALFVSAVGGACDHSTPETAPLIEQPSGTCISLGPTVSPNFATLSPGDTLRPTVAAPCGFPATAPFRWSTSDSKIASVDSVTGLVTAQAQGSATIVAALVADRTIKGAMLVQVKP